ncbi:MAG: glycosyltransferase family 25 protein [Actinomycetes bacterium]
MPIENYVIHLASQSVRKTEFLDRNGGFATFNWSAGRLGSELNLSSLVAEGLLAAEMVAEPIVGPNPRFTAPALGSSLAHVDLWKLAVAENQSITILENDAILAPNYQSTITDLTGAHPDFDFIQWGWNWDSKFHARILGNMGLVECHFSQAEIPSHITNFQKLVTPHLLVKLIHSWGIHCYTISPKGAEKLLNTVLPLSTKLIDRLDVGVSYYPTTLDGIMNGLYPKLNAYACWPPLTVAENDQARSSVGQLTLP